LAPECGGQSGTNDVGYVIGAPELLAEIAESSRSLDLHGKRDDYRRHGVREYLVVNLKDKQLHWFDFAADEQPSPDSDGIARLRSMPGLWMDVPALFEQDLARATGGARTRGVCQEAGRGEAGVSGWSRGARPCGFSW
jgi:hypothetical protein